MNAGVYLINPGLIEGILKKGMDFGKDIIPRLIEKNVNVFGYKLENNIIAIDTPEMLNKQLRLNYEEGIK